MSVVLCLPAHLRVSRSVPWPAPHGNASGDGTEVGEAYKSGTKSEHYWAHWTSAYDGKPPSTYLLSCTHIHALRRSTFSSTPSFYWFTSNFYWNFWYPPYWIYKSYWVQSGY